MNWFRNLKVAYKILISCVVFITMIITIVLFSIRSMGGVNLAVKDYRENYVLPVIKMGEFAKNLIQGRVLMFELKMSDGSQNEIEKFNTGALDIREKNTAIFKLLKDRSMSEKDKSLTATFEQKYSEIGKTLIDFLAAIKRGDKKQSELLMNTWIRQYNDITPVLEELKDEGLKTGAGKIASEFDQMKMIRIYMLIILGISVLCGIILTLVLSKSISGPVQKGLTFAQKLADGDFTGRIDLKQKDELGMLSSALNEAADKLENTVLNILDASNNLAQAVEQIASGNQNLSQRTSEQASALEEVAATIEEANSSINQNYENSVQAKKMSEISSHVANQGGELVENAVHSINEINASTKKIGEITTVINEISFQTNLLALNAAVEAARAGEQGRGFAVVAGEVRNLAQRAGNAAKEIAHLINDTVVKVEDGTDKTYKSGNALKEIIESVTNVARFVEEISESSNEQKQGMDQIATAISDLDSMTQHNAALVEETAAASEEMSNQAQELMSLVSLFKIREKISTVSKKIPGNGKSVTHKNLITDDKNQSVVTLEHENFEQF